MADRRPDYIVVEGPIGVGKTSLARRLAESFESDLLLEGADDTRFPIVRIQLRVGERVFADMRLTEILMPKGRLGTAPPADRRRFLRDGEYVDGVGLGSILGVGHAAFRFRSFASCGWQSRFDSLVPRAYKVGGQWRGGTTVLFPILFRREPR